jgi:predicted CXXCH cytochrome family protein
MEANAANKCVNCHDPHGWADGVGVIPNLLVAREENLCLTCHDGFPAMTDVRSDFQKPFRHPAPEWFDRHRGAGESLPEDFGTSPTDQRHAECEDCHNSHVARADRAGTLAPPAASKTLLGVSRVQVLNGGAGSVPSFVFSPESDTLSAPVAEYQLCFKCHSSWTTQPFGQPDMAVLFNPANPSYHPVEAPGKNPNIASFAFIGGWDSSSMMYCGDCHGSDLEMTRGPHGSIYQHILKRPYTASSFDHTSTPDELCFACHAYDTYADKSSPDLIQSASRWNEPEFDKGHAWHVDGRGVPCYACHDSHGSTTLPHLLVTGRNPGLIDFTETATSGTCTPACHRAKTYTVNYAR